MPYAALTDVQARAGRLLDDVTQNPSATEVEGFLADTAEKIDAFLNAAGHDTPTVSPAAVQAIRADNADGALVLALEARYGSKAGGEVSAVLEGARARWNFALLMLRDGKHPAVGILDNEAPATGGVGLATSFGSHRRRTYRPPGVPGGGPANPYADTPIHTGMMT